MAGRSVIHKQVIELKENLIPFPEYTFEVPEDAEMVDIQWDATNQFGIAFWYKTALPASDFEGQDLKFWKMLVRDTGESFPEECLHQATVVRDGIVLHVLNAPGSEITWADL